MLYSTINCAVNFKNIRSHYYFTMYLLTSGFECFDGCGFLVLFAQSWRVNDAIKNHSYKHFNFVYRWNVNNEKECI